MTEPRTNRPTGWSACAIMKGTEMTENTSTKAPVSPAIVVPQDAIDAILKAPLSATNSVGVASIEFYRAASAASGIDYDSLTPDETVELTRRLYAVSADYRRGQADVVKAAKAAKAAADKADRDTKRKQRLEAEKAALLAKLAKIDG